MIAPQYKAKLEWEIGTMQAVKNRWLRAAVVGTAVLVFLFAMIFPDWARRALKNDRAGAVPQQGIATVALRVETRPSVTDTPSPPEILVRFRGQIYAAKAITGFDALQVDQPARIVYRVGKSGRIYVDSVAPMSAAAPRP